jgi:energy-coupling factor transporter ATP-binding protein EcfA2
MKIAKKTCPVVFTGEALASIPVAEHDWVVDKLFRTNRRRPSLIAGKPGSGKSTLAWQMAIAVTKGEPFLGRQTKSAEVLYWQSEETQEDCGAILREHVYDSSQDERIHVAMGASWGDTLDEQLETLAEFLSAHPSIRLVIIETLDDFLKLSDVKENSAAREAFEKFDTTISSRFAQQAAFVALHHIKKRETDHSGDGLLGASVINGKTDVKVYLNVVSDDDPRRIIHSTGRRDSVVIPRTYLDFDSHTGRSRLGMTVAEERKCNAGKNADRIAEDIITFIANNPNSTESDCLSLIQGNSDTKRQAFKKLRLSGALQLSGKGTKGSPLAFHLANPIPVEDRREIAEAA